MTVECLLKSNELVWSKLQTSKDRATSSSSSPWALAQDTMVISYSVT